MTIVILITITKAYNLGLWFQRVRVLEGRAKL